VPEAHLGPDMSKHAVGNSSWHVEEVGLVELNVKSRGLLLKEATSLLNVVGAKFYTDHLAA